MSIVNSIYGRRFTADPHALLGLYLYGAAKTYPLYTVLFFCRFLSNFLELKKAKLIIALTTCLVILNT